MIKQTALLFKLKDLEVFSITYVGSRTLIATVSASTVGIIEEIWWSIPALPKGHGPFPSLYAAMKDYEQYVALIALPPPIPRPEYDTTVIPVDFKAKSRLGMSVIPNDKA